MVWDRLYLELDQRGEYPELARRGSIKRWVVDLSEALVVGDMLGERWTME